MKKKNKTKNIKLFDLIGIAIAIAFILFGSYFIYGLTSSMLTEDKSIISDKVWCNNCQTYHDKETAEAEEQKLIWCVNCKKYHAPGQDE